MVDDVGGEGAGALGESVETAVGAPVGMPKPGGDATATSRWTMMAWGDRNVHRAEGSQRSKRKMDESAKRPDPRSFFTPSPLQVCCSRMLGGWEMTVSRGKHGRGNAEISCQILYFRHNPPPEFCFVPEEPGKRDAGPVERASVRTSACFSFIVPPHLVRRFWETSGRRPW